MRPDQAFAAALAHHRKGELAEAENLYRQVLAADSRHADSLHQLGVIALQIGRGEAAAALLAKAIEIDGGQALFHANLAIALQDIGRAAAAMEANRAALRLAPDLVEARYNLGCSLLDQGRAEDAASAFRAVLARAPDHAGALGNLCNACQKLGLPAVASGRAAVRLAPGIAAVWSNLGGALRIAGRNDEAIAAWRSALRLDRDFAEAHANLGNALRDLGRSEEAAAAYDMALQTHPDLAEVRAQRLHLAQQQCDWRIQAEHRSRLDVSQIPPYIALTLDTSPAEQLDAARYWARERCQGIVPLQPPGERPGGRIRLGYLSAELRAHAVPILMVELIERHDRGRFEIFGYSIGADDGSPMRRRLEQSFDHFADLAHLSHRAAAERIRADRIDILLDLSGATKDARPEILALRPAAVNVNYLGYPGTMGGDFMDYIVADAICVPAEDECHFSEKIIRLPDCYQPNDTRREIAAKTPSRSECGLPDQGFVFCCFNNSHKITAEFFEIWTRLLSRIPGSVLWLLDGHAGVATNLRREAEARGIAPERMVFAPRIPPPEHLARHRLAGLFLDTLPYNAHTTASDALWAGLPVLTCLGDAFAGRVAGSLLHAVGLPELVTRSLGEYESKAAALAEDPAELASCRARLAATRLTAPLFDILRYTTNFEAALASCLAPGTDDARRP